MDILMIEDEENITSFVTLELEYEGFTVLSAANGREGLQLFEKRVEEKNPFSLVLLDIMLPELNGLEVLRRIRKISETPIILLTARGETIDRVTGLDAGADDYLTKPFAIEELLARIRSVLRRSENQSAGEASPAKEDVILSFYDLKLHTEKHEVFMGETAVHLTRTEFLLLECLLKNKNKVLDRETIITQVWGAEHYIDENSVDVYVRYLRSKIDDRFSVSYISTVRGVGYIMKEE
ncbi:MAG: response regulator transcription factor [Treponemataceae bacterium]